jgi:lycopene cyclase domain-containing protein
VDEYLLFDLVVIAGPRRRRASSRRASAAAGGPAIAAALLVAVPFVAWDLAVTGRHWWFDTAPHPDLAPLDAARRVALLPDGAARLRLHVGDADGGWPIPRPSAAAGRPWAVAGLLVLAAAAAGMRGLEYTAFASGSLALAIALDLATGGRVVRHRRFVPFALLVLAFTGVFNGYLTARPLVLYDPRHQLDVRVGTIPVEDFAYGLALVIANVVVLRAPS